MDASFIAINIAYFLYVAATIPKKIIPLRLTLIVASIAFVIYGLIDNNRSVIVWNLLFGFPQLYQLLHELRAQAKISLTEEEESVRSTRFATMSPRDFLTFWSIGEDRDVGSFQLTTQDEPNSDLVLVLSGVASVSIDGQHVADRGPGNLIGEASFVTGDSASATVVMSPDATVRMWPHDKLEVLSRAQPDVAASLLSTFARELSLKMRSKAS